MLFNNIDIQVTLTYKFFQDLNYILRILWWLSQQWNLKSWKVKPDNFEPQNSLKLIFRTTWGLCSNFIECESLLESNSSDILALCETNLDDSIDSGNFSVKGYVPLIWKYTITHMYGLAVYVCERRTSFLHGTYLVNEILLINPSANVFDFGDFNIHYKDWLTFSGGTFLLKSKQPAHDKGKLLLHKALIQVHMSTHISIG